VRTLFDDSPAFDRDGLANRLAALARSQVFLGTSSWKYPGWLDQIYTPSRYMSRGRLSKKRFEAECISEYAEVFPTVCGDFAFYQFPTPALWESLFRRVPPHFQFTLKVPEQITRMKFPEIERYGSQSGQRNPSFLDAELLQSQLLDALQPFQKNINVLIFEFGALPYEQAQHPERFFDRLEQFLFAVPRMFRMAVEVRNPELLVPAYFDCLRHFGVAHVYNLGSDAGSHRSNQYPRVSDSGLCCLSCPFAERPILSASCRAFPTVLRTQGTLSACSPGPPRDDPNRNLQEDAHLRFREQPSRRQCPQHHRSSHRHH
jgi:uncharacterized protein YecE (DUF72 family)